MLESGFLDRVLEFFYLFRWARVRYPYRDPWRPPRQQKRPWWHQ